MSHSQSPGPSPIDVKSALERLIVGELRADEAVLLAAEAGYRTFADLCEAELPEHLPKVRIERTTVRDQIGRAIAGKLPLDELRAWAEELAAVLDRHELGVSVVERRRISEALALVAVAADVRIFRNRGPVLGVLSAVARSLGRRRAGNVSVLYGALFQNQPEFHLLARRLEDIDGEEEDGPEPTGEVGPPTFLPQGPSFMDSLGLGALELDTGLDRAWMQGDEPEGAGEQQPKAAEGLRCADVVALNRPYEPGTRVQDYEWVVAFSVATRSLVQEDTVPGTPAPGFMERARELAPNFEFARYKPEARRDQDGVLEVVLDAPSIGKGELAYAAKLFALVHQVGVVTFEGVRLSTIGPGPRPVG
ncbi:MAG: hypothetical protein KF878_27560 [Planctomycetes bacterium]|nr:hypothetical protein [Planctomycetota bacterium]